MSRFLKASPLRQPLYILIHDIRSVYNVASIFRTAECAGVTHIYVSGYSPAPLDRFSRPRSDFAKVALGSEKRVPWTYVEDVEKFITSVKDDGAEVVALEQNESSKNIWSYTPEKPILLIVGREVEGVDTSLLAMSDVILEIPMRGEKESLNVSVATGVALFHIASRLE